MKGLDAALAKYPFLDGTRVAAAGGSYGGYMIDWMASQAKGRFKVLVSHAGVYDITSKYGATEELWFPEAEFKGTPWSSRDVYDRWSPHLRAAEFGKYKTPTLVIAGELDFRVVYTQSLEFFTALQRQERPVAADRLSRRGTLDPQTREQRVLVSGSTRAGSRSIL